MNVDADYDDRFSKRWLNLADERFGTKVVYTTDDFFAEKENLIKPGRGIFIPDKYTENGKWMDGWESRRKRIEGHDYCDIKLGAAGKIFAFDIDTNHFLGNHPPHASVDACFVEGDGPDENTKWTEVLPKSPLGPGQQNLFEIENEDTFNFVRLHIYPDGGVARFRVFGEVVSLLKAGEEEDLAYALNGGRALFANDMFFSSKDNLIMPGRGKDMGDGWETKRRREPGNDWVVLSLAKPGEVKEIEIDTAHFKGNFPESFDLEAINLGHVGEFPPGEVENKPWKKMVESKRLEADNIATFPVDHQLGTITHVRMNIYPDGGVSRLRLRGRVSE